MTGASRGLAEAAIGAEVRSPSRPANDHPGVDYGAYVDRRPDGISRLHLLVEGIHCGGCIQKIERALRALPEVVTARVNMSTRRLTVTWQGADRHASVLAKTVEDLGFRVAPFDPGRLSGLDDATEKTLLRCLAVAGFAAANVMLLSVSVWAGHFEDMGEATRGLFHWLSALIVLPALAYAGRPFYASALTALRAGRTNMDVPISLGVVLAAGMSLFETIRGGPHAYFDSAIVLVFFLLIGRTLDHKARGRAHSAAERLLALGASAVTVLDDSGRRHVLKPDQVRTGMTVLAAAGERIAVDGQVVDGTSEIDTSLITGESVPGRVGTGDKVFAGTVNLTVPLRLRVLAVGQDTLLAEIIRLMELAEQRRARYVNLADRVSRLYAPAVHGLALATFLGWWLIMGSAWQLALLYAVAVLIVTCPCALGLAVPAVQVIASGRLMRRGILLKSATALERLAGPDTVVFDKTGTLTTGQLKLRDPTRYNPETLDIAAALAGVSTHPLSRALCRTHPNVPVAERVKEVPGRGLLLANDQGEVRLGSRRWCGVAAKKGGESARTDDDNELELWLSRPGRDPVRFVFSDSLRPDAKAVIGELKRRGLAVEILSGDRPDAVADIAAQLGITNWQAGRTPAQKTERLEALANSGHHVLMVGDGLNDAPALAAATVSMSPASAADISQVAADVIFQSERLAPIIDVIDVARRADRLVKQNFALAIGYNLIAVPLAVLGFVTPLIAAACMSGSSIVVVGNALRLGWERRR